MTKLIPLSLLAAFLAISASAATNLDTSRFTAADYESAIRNNDVKALRSMAAAGSVDVRDRLEWTPLHFAALYGSVDAVRILLDAGADPNARNRPGATPLAYAAYSFDKARLLVEKGADVNAKTNDGSTPLWVATGVPGNGKTIRYLVEKGADVKQARSGTDYLIRAAEYEDASTVRFFLAKGLDPRHANAAGATALIRAIHCDGDESARVLLDAGADVNVFTTDAGRVKNGPIDSFGITPLMEATLCGDASLASALVKAGANVNAVDHRHMTALMMAVGVDNANPETAKVLLDAHADLTTADRYSATALDWARKYRNPAMLALLDKAGAPGSDPASAPVPPSGSKPSAREAIDRASALLANSNEVFFREGGGCIGCHHQPFAGRAFGAAKAAGLPAEPRLRQILVNGLVAERPGAMIRLPLMTIGGGGYTNLLYPLAGMADMGEPASQEIDTMVHFLAVSQSTNGSWNAPGDRPPLQESAITQTMLAMYALKTYAWPARRDEFDARIARARSWLANATAYTTVEESDRLMGLWLAGAPQADLEKVAGKVLAAQREDGGWAQTRYLQSDAFGTAAALYTLRKTGFLRASDAAYRKGAQFLLNTQFPDGSWYVRSRVMKLQPYFQSAFPFNHDQWISNTSTAYAVMALAPVAANID